MHPRSKFWFECNLPITPEMVCWGSDATYMFVCDKIECGHKFQSSPNRVTNNRWCPFCTDHIELCKDEACAPCHAKSLASVERAVACWHPTKNNTECTPRNVRKASHQMAWFKCDKCHHDFATRASSVTGGHWCPFCATFAGKTCGDKECVWCYGRSLASFLDTCNAVIWDEKVNDASLKPWHVCMASSAIIAFVCVTCSHSFKCTAYNVSSGHGCGRCTHKTERKLFDALSAKFPTLQRPYKADWCRSTTVNRVLPFDFAMEADKIIIELDGNHHFRKVMNWKKSPEDNHARDVYKQTRANDNGFRVIRILQTDVWSDRNDWLNKLLAAIEELRGNGGAVANIYISSGNQYDIFINPPPVAPPLTGDQLCAPPSPKAAAPSSSKKRPRPNAAC